jgi:hypothetical protein
METLDNMAMFLMNELAPKKATPEQRKLIKATFYALDSYTLTELFNIVKGNY